MDIENMHPFCLPFGLCHDATSSSITADLVGANNNGQNNNGTTTNISPTSSPSSMSPLSPSSKESRLSSQRSKNSSPSDELFRQLNSISSTTVLGQSLLNHHDLIIGASASLDIIADESFYSSLDILGDDEIGEEATKEDDENRLRKSSIATDVDGLTDSDQGKHDEEEEGEGEDEEQIDWYCNEYSLFSPMRRKSISSAAAIRATNLLHHQVFQHLVDPIDIKSSPTLAQLNLNSSDNDPIDGFWDTATTTSLSSVNHHHNHHHHSSSLSSLSSSSAPTNTDLFSNCTSINKNSLTAGTCCSHTLSNHHHNHHLNQNHTSSAESIACNHSNHHPQAQHHHQNQSHHLSSSYSSTHLTSASSLSSSLLCPHQQASQQQQQQATYQHSCRCSTALQNSTCSSTAPFVGAHQPTCCNSTQRIVPTPSHSSHLNSGSSNNFNGLNLKQTSALSELNQQQQTLAGNHHPASKPCSTTAVPSQNCEHDPKKRPASPVLVTSSSSPLSSAPATTPGQQKQHHFSSVDADLASTGAGESNKLKENIEYLTALLCNGNKQLENSNQQPSSMSPSIARSYTTLAHSLSTEPKLLERSLQPSELSTPIGGPQTTSANNLTPNHPTNEAAPTSADANSIQAGTIKRMQHPLQQQHNHQQWIKVDSSISAADSTETTSSYMMRQASHDCTTSGQLHPQCHLQHIGNQLNLPQQHHQCGSGDMRVLNSLLSGGTAKCLQGCMNQSAHQNHSSCARWQPPTNQLNHLRMNLHSSQMSVDSASIASDCPQQQMSSSSSIPPNGRPITLTPIASHNNPILQQHITSKIKPSPFIQPASPSASSTASSGANTDIGSSGSGPTIKKPRLAQSSVAKSSSAISKSSSSNRSVRPSSMSTEGSLSSHDEGFSSQIDPNDDCNSTNRDSDDDDEGEVDSDDESFYGDYTNNDLIGASISDDAENKWTLNMGRTRRNGQKRYFWQYNVQSKGPKGTRICSTDDSENPFVLPEASDPVFSNDCQVEGVKHSGKARRGDGNDLTPNPKKLLMIGLELKKLGKIINELAPVTDLPINARTKTRKEKNKLASRACRLKKKAQHEANKIKLYGLQREHQQVVLAIYDVRKLLNQALAQKDNGSAGSTGGGGHLPPQQGQSSSTSEQPSQTTPPSSTTTAPANVSSANSSQLTAVGGGGNGMATLSNALGPTSASVSSIAEQCSMWVAGQTSDFVNSVLEKVVSGCIDGGLET